MRQKRSVQPFSYRSDQRWCSLLFRKLNKKDTIQLTITNTQQQQLNSFLLQAASSTLKTNSTEEKKFIRSRRHCINNKKLYLNSIWKSNRSYQVVNLSKSIRIKEKQNQFAWSRIAVIFLNEDCADYGKFFPCPFLTIPICDALFCEFYQYYYYFWANVCIQNKIEFFDQWMRFIVHLVILVQLQMSAASYRFV